MPRSRATPKTPDPSPATATLLQRIEAARDELRPSERQAADYVLQHPNEVIDLSFAELATRAGVSQPTIARFCNALGFSGLREFKLRLAKSLATGLPYIHHDVNAQDSSAEVGAKVFDRAIAALVTVRNHLDPSSLTRAVEALCAARRIEFYGVGNSGIVAMDAQHKFFRLGVPTAALSDTHVQAMSASLLEPGDVLVAISGSGRTRDVIRSVEIGREAGATAIGLTVPGSPLARACDISLNVDVPEDPDVYAPMTSRLAHLAVLDVLAVSVALARGPELVAQLRRSKAVLQEKRTPES